MNSNIFFNQAGRWNIEPALLSLKNTKKYPHCQAFSHLFFVFFFAKSAPDKQ